VEVDVIQITTQMRILVAIEAVRKSFAGRLGNAPRCSLQIEVCVQQFVSSGPF